MRDVWVGDVGDYFKYALLRYLSGHTSDDKARLALGVLWYCCRSDRRAPGQGKQHSRRSL